jgi:uncharacterized protein YecT (DUF1311 family)
MRRAAAFRSPLAAVAAGVLFVSCAALADEDVAALKLELQQDDSRLNQIYQTVRQRLDGPGQSSLKSTQRAWIAFKEKDFAIFSSLARMANDPDRAYAYESEETEGRTEALRSLGKPGNPGSGEGVKTAREADQILNNVYRRCISLLPPDKAQAVKEAEALWIEFRDLHCQLDAALKGGQADDSVLSNLTLRRVDQLGVCLNVMLRTQLSVPANPDQESADSDGDATATGSPPADVYRFAR